VFSDLPSPLDLGKIDDGILDGECEVARDAKDFGYSNVLESRKNVLITVVGDAFDESGLYKIPSVAGLAAGPETRDIINLHIGLIC
jgi:hypothetical protein